jgi:molybdate transport system substrate-binding protein
LASADAVRIGAIGASLAGPVTVFADNRLAIVVPLGNPAGVRTLSDLTGLRFVALCDEAAPCGRYAAEVLVAAGVALDESHVTRAPDASATLRAVTRGDADAAIVYATDARAAGRAVTTVAIPAAVNRTVPYGIAVLDRAEDPDLAREFVAAVTGPTGRAVLGAAGFGLP